MENILGLGETEPRMALNSMINFLKKNGKPGRAHFQIHRGLHLKASFLTVTGREWASQLSVGWYPTLQASPLPTEDDGGWRVSYKEGEEG